MKLKIFVYKINRLKWAKIIYLSIDYKSFIRYNKYTSEQMFDYKKLI